MYSCPRCEYTTDRRSNYLSHLRRKTPCYTGGNISKVQPASSSEDSNNDGVDFPVMASTHPLCFRGQQDRSCPTTFPFVCETCGERFRHRSNLSRHKSHRHPVSPPNMLEQGERIQNLETELSTLREHIRDHPSTTHNNNNNNNTHNNSINININAFGRENTSNLSPELLTRCIKRTTKGLVELVEKLHFDEISNRNLRATLQHPEQVEYYDGTNWKYAPRGRVMRQVVDSGHSIMSEHYDNNSENIRKSMTISLYDFVQGWMKKMDRTNASTYADAMNEVYCCVLNRTRELSSESSDA